MDHAIIEIILIIPIATTKKSDLVTNCKQCFTSHVQLCPEIVQGRTT